MMAPAERLLGGHLEQEGLGRDQRAGTAMRSLSVKSLTLWIAGLRVLSWNGVWLIALTPLTPIEP